jgi:hypothetical protein
MDDRSVAPIPQFQRDDVVIPAQHPEGKSRWVVERQDGSIVTLHHISETTFHIRRNARTLRKADQ